jgi:hypothetical protein
MKRIILSVMFACMMAICAQAQMYVGGSIGAYYDAGKTKSGSTTNKGSARIAFELSPMFGYYLSDDVSVGAMLNLGLFNTNDRRDPASKDKRFMFGIAPYIRKSILDVGNLSLLLEANIGIFGTTSKNTYESTTNEGPKTFTFGLNVLPVLSYNLTDRLNLEARVNLLRLSFGATTQKQSGSETKHTDSFFGLGVNPSFLHDMLPDDMMLVTPLQIAAIFKF